MEAAGEGRGEQKHFGAFGLLAFGRPLADPSQNLLPEARRRLSRQKLRLPRSSWKSPLGHRTTRTKQILRTVGSGNRKVLYQTQTCPLFSKIFKEEKFSK